MFDEILDAIYFNVGHPAGYSSVQKLYKAAKKVNQTIKLRDVKNYLIKQKVYTLHHPVQKKFQRRKTITSGLNKQFQMDLVILDKYSRYNSGVKHLLMVIDVFSRYAFVKPLKTKTGKEVSIKLEEIFALRKPVAIQADDGGEFFNVHVKTLLDKHKIKLFSVSSDTKSALVERFNRTFKNRMFRYFTKHNTYRYIDILQDLVNAYNKSKHRIIGMAPVSVTKENEKELWNKQYKNEFTKHAKFKFEIGDKVRITKLQSIFAKSYLPLWSDEYFMIKYRFATKPPTYKLIDLNGEILIGSFYRQEIQKIIP